jgi:hypothetical protein
MTDCPCGLIDGWIRCLIPLTEDKTGLLFSNLKPLEVDPVALDEEVGKKLLAVRQGKIMLNSLPYFWTKRDFLVR